MTVLNRHADHFVSLHLVNDVVITLSQFNNQLTVKDMSSLFFRFAQ